MAKYTRSPWNVSHSGYANAPFVIFAGERAPNYKSKFPLSGINTIAEVFHDESPAHEEQRANARLIATAPELLECLDTLLDIAPFARDDNERQLHLRCETVLRKAKGEPEPKR